MGSNDSTNMYEWGLPNYLTIGDNTPAPFLKPYAPASTAPVTPSLTGSGFGPTIQPTINSSFMGGQAYPGQGVVNPSPTYGANGPLRGSVEPAVTDTGAGGWFDLKGKGGMALGGAQTLLGAFNSWMNYKSQKFMENYYGKQQAMQLADFSNNAKSANLGIQNRFMAQLSNAGIDPNSAAGQQQTADYMNKWKVKETI